MCLSVVLPAILTVPAVPATPLDVSAGQRHHEIHTGHTPLVCVIGHMHVLVYLHDATLTQC